MHTCDQSCLREKDDHETYGAIGPLMWSPLSVPVDCRRSFFKLIVGYGRIEGIEGQQMGGAGH